MKRGSEKSALMKRKMSTFNEFCHFRLCNLILATPPEKRNYCENASVRTMDSDQTHKQKASLSKASASCQCFKLYTISTVKKWQTVAAQASVQNIRQDKPQLCAKYSCKTGLFHRFQPGNKISKIWAGAPSSSETKHEGALCVLPVRWRAVKTLSGEC